MQIASRSISNNESFGTCDNMLFSISSASRSSRGVRKVSRTIEDVSDTVTTQFNAASVAVFSLLPIRIASNLDKLALQRSLEVLRSKLVISEIVTDAHVQITV